MIRSGREIHERLDETIALSRSRQAILEEYLDGVELNGLLAVRGGEPTLLTLSDRLRPPGIGFGVGWIHSFPSSLPGDTLEEVREVAVAAVRALGLRDGIAFPQLIATADGVRVIEVAARIAAGQMADLVELGTGIKLFDIAIAQALGDEVPDQLVTARFTRPIAIRFLTASPGVLPVGPVSSIDRLELVRDSPGVLAANLYVGVGSTIRPVQVDADRSGYVIATAATPAKALELANRAARKLVVRVAAPERVRRPLPRRALAGVLAAVVLGTALTFALGTGPKLNTALIASARADAQVSPTCHCPHDLAHIAFRLLHRARITLELVNRAGRPVATIVRDRTLSTGLKRFIWRGRDKFGRVLPTGGYRPEIVFDALHRSQLFPGSIHVDQAAQPAVMHYG
jgi:hypothetical protein